MILKSTLGSRISNILLKDSKFKVKYGDHTSICLDISGSLNIFSNGNFSQI